MIYLCMTWGVRRHFLSVQLKGFTFCMRFFQQHHGWVISVWMEEKQTLSLLVYFLGQICLLWIIVIADSSVKYYPFWKIYTRVFILSTYKGLQTWASLRCCDVIELPPVPIFIIFLALFITLFIYLLFLCLMVSMFLSWLVSLCQFAL